MLKTELMRRNRVESAGDIPRPVISASVGVVKIVTKKTMPLASHRVSIPKCHQRASPIEWRLPGRPTPSGRVSESFFAVYSGSVGTGFCIRNQSLPGVECLVR
jgi:hypothetical protein